eukprot:766908-Pleurochrysis_carterae.AAC.1
MACPTSPAQMEMQANDSMSEVASEKAEEGSEHVQGRSSMRRRRVRGVSPRRAVTGVCGRTESLTCARTSGAYPAVREKNAVLMERAAVQLQTRVRTA